MRRLLAVPLSVVLLLSLAGAVSAQDSEATATPAEAPSEQAATPSAEGGAAAEAPAEPAGDAEAATGGDVPAGDAAGGEGADATVSEGDTTNTAEQETVDAGTYGVRLRDLEQRINELKEQIFRSKARLSLLAETVLQGVVAGAQAHIVHENKMGNSYKLVKVIYALDGAPIFNKADETGGLGEREEFDVYNGSIVPGEHTLTVQLEYRGHGYGIFSYLKGYRFKVNSSHTFGAPEGKGTQLRVVGYEKGGPTAPLEERPAIRYVERISDVAAAESGEGGE